MYGNSRTVTSNQRDIHPALERLHPAADHFRKPHNPDTVRALDMLEGVRDDYDELIIDHACGYGESTQRIASDNPQALVLGVERSPHRLASYSLTEGYHRDNNRIVLLADCIDVWLQASARGWRTTQQYFLYPNPWPKRAHLQRRWHAHPAFPYVLTMGGRIELRTNWHTYAEEFAQVLSRLEPQRSVSLGTFKPDTALTRFERKYHDSGHSLYRVCAVLTGSPP